MSELAQILTSGAAVCAVIVAGVILAAAVSRPTRGAYRADPAGEWRPRRRLAGGR